MNSFSRHSKSISLFILIALLLGVLSACTGGDVDESVQETIAARDALSTQTAVIATETAVAQSTIDAANATATAAAEQAANALANEATRNAENAASNNATATAIAQLATRTAAGNVAMQQTAVSIAATQTAAAIIVTAPPPIVPTSAYLLNSTFPPVHGIATLSTGFIPNPHQVYAVAGGNANAGSRNLGYDCIGYVERAPDYRVNWAGNSNELTFAFVANAAGADTTLVINDPNETWFCNDNTDGLNPRVVIPNSVNGQYDIWIGSHNGAAYDGLLTVTELNGNTPPPAVSTGGLLPMSMPNFGTATLTTGFTPDPYVVDVISGGYVDVTALNLGYDCEGFATEAPDFRLNWTGGGTEIGIYFSSAMGEDATLIISDAYGKWLCNDDYSTSDNPLDPAIFINAATSGQYDIWIGSYSATDRIAGQLRIVERY